MIRRPPRSTPLYSSAASDVYKRQGLADGTIDVVATDHAPHPSEDKDCEWEAAAAGMTGLETALGIVQSVMVDSGLMTWRDVARVMSATCRSGMVDPSRWESPPTSPW